MDVRLFSPPADLDPWVSAGMAVAFDDETAQPLPCHFPALLAAGLTFVVHGRLFIEFAGRLYPLPSAAIGGPRTAPITVYRTPRLHCVGLMLRPAGIAAVMHESPVALLQQVTEASDVLNDAWREYLAPLEDAEDDPTRIQILFTLMRSRVRGDVHWRRTRDALRLQQAATLPLCQAAPASGLSTRQFERRFAASFGMAPKLFQRIARIESVLRDLMATSATGAALALRHGYYDQSHMGRDFRMFVGTAPNALLEELRAGGGGHWPLSVGARYRVAGLRPDFPLPEGDASFFS